MASFQDVGITVSNATKGGRPRSFDRDAVLDALVQLFWEQGYEATSMTDIVEATGLSKSSLYNAFGSKDVLHREALSRYLDLHSGAIALFLDEGTAGLADIHSFFDWTWEVFYDNCDHRGCLAVNSSTELGPRNSDVVAAARQYRTSMRDAFRAALSRGAHQGEIAPELIETYVNLCVTNRLGLAVLIRSGANSDEVLAHLDAARHQVDSWKLR